jgi:hypothetical protein
MVNDAKYIHAVNIIDDSKYTNCHIEDPTIKHYGADDTRNYA